MIGKIISHYKILEELGRGGMGIVYKARDLKLDRPVALKFLPQHLTASEEEKKRFIHEAKAASSLQHHNICTIHEIDETGDGQMFIAMDYYEGHLLQLSIDKRQVTIDQSIDTAIQIATGLQKAHEKGIIHRDLKPANIMLTPDGVVKLLDFGLAKQSAQTKLTKEGTTLGTVAYMSPEQVKGYRADRRSDIWSLGVILYEMITGQTPFEGDYDQALMYAITNEDPQPLTGIRSGVPLELERIVNRMLAKDREDRYQHVDDLISELNRLKKDSDSAVTTHGTLPPKTKNRKTLITAISSAALIVLIAGYWLLSPQPRKNENIASAEGKNSLAVLPFDNISNDPDQEFFCKGMTEQIETNLGQLERLEVFKLDWLMNYGDGDINLPQILKKFNIAYILEGSIQKYGNRIRVTAQLINAADGFHIWSEDYDNDFEDLFNIQDEVSNKIASSILQKLSKEEIVDIKMNRPLNTDAYEYYMKGRYYHLTKYYGEYKVQNLQIAKDMLTEALRLDPDYADAHAAMADLYNTYYNRGKKTEEEKKQLIELQQMHLDHALNSGMKSPEILHAKAQVYKALADYQYEQGEHQKCEKYIDDAFTSLHQALKIAKNNDNIYWSLAIFYWQKGLYLPMSKCFDKAIELNPLGINHYNYYICYSYWLGHYDKVEEMYKKLLEIVPYQYLATLWYFNTLLTQKKTTQAERLLVNFERYDPEREISQQHAKLLALKGERDNSLSISKKKSIIVYALLGMSDEIIKILSKNLDKEKVLKDDTYKYFWMQSPLFDKVRSDPRFQEIQNSYKKMYEYNLERYGYTDF